MSGPVHLTPPKLSSWECVHVAIDDRSCIAFIQAYADRASASARAFLDAVLALYERCSIRMQRSPTDDGSAYGSKGFAQIHVELRLKHRFTRAHRPRTNCEADRFFQTAPRE